jgi:hypothetical protein
VVVKAKGAVLSGVVPTLVDQARDPVKAVRGRIAIKARKSTTVSQLL